MTARKTIRRRLVIAVLTATAPIVALGSYLLYRQVAHSLRAGFDAELRDSALVLADLAEHDEDGYEFEMDDATARALGANQPAHVELWLPDGELLYRSERLRHRDLHLPRDRGGRPPRVTDASLPGEPELRVASYAFVPRSEDTAVTPGTMTLAIARPRTRLQADLANLRAWFAGGTVLLLAAIALLIVRGVAIGLAPLRAVAREIETLDASTLEGRVGSNVPTELRPLVDRLNELLERHQQEFARERRFTADAAHELRTPLAVMRTQMEVALRRDRDAADYRGVLGSSLRTIAELTRCVDALLLIARADSGRILVNGTRVPIADLVEGCWQSVADTAERRGIELTTEIATDAAIDTDRDLVRAIASNLLSNAAHHASADSAVRVESKPEQGVVLRVENRADALAPNDVSHLFERFWRHDLARTETELHSGLGLSVVRSLCTCLGFDVAAELEGGTLSITVRTTKEDDHA